MVALDALWLEGRALGRLAHLAQDPNRLRLWQTALRMALDHPLLGVGTGRYAFFFQEYAGELARGFGPFWGTAHSLYLHLLAEQGLIGLASFVVLFGGVWLGAARRLTALDELPGPGARRPARRARRLARLRRRPVHVPGPRPRLSRRAARRRRGRRSRRPRLGGSPAGSSSSRSGSRSRSSAGGRSEALRRPVTPGYEAGFHRWERQPDGRAARWTRGRAALSVPVRGPALELAFRAPIRDVAARPQQVRVWLDGRPAAALTLATPDWQAVTLPVGRPSRGRRPRRGRARLHVRPEPGRAVARRPPPGGHDGGADLEAGERALTPSPTLPIIARTVDGLERAVDCSVVIVNYHTDEVLAECLASLAKTAGGLEVEVIVVDNSATLAGGGFRERFSGVRLVENPGNVGFARAANQGIRLARGRHVLCLNPDTVVHDGALAAMAGHLDAHPRVGAVGARLLESDGSLQYSCRRFPGYATILFGRYALLTRLFPGNTGSRDYLYLDWDHRTVRAVDWVSGACLMVRREVLRAASARSTRATSCSSRTWTGAGASATPAGRSSTCPTRS